MVIYKALKTAKNAFLGTFLDIKPSKYDIGGSKSLEKVDISCFLIIIYRFNAKAQKNFFFKKICKGPPFGLFPIFFDGHISRKDDSNFEIPKEIILLSSDKMFFYENLHAEKHNCKKNYKKLIWVSFYNEKKVLSTLNMTSIIDFSKL